MVLGRTAKFFRLRGVSILEQLKFEELLLRTTEFNSVVVNSGMSYPAIVLGFSGKPLELLHIDRVIRDKLLVIRRFTGGGTVIVDNSTVFASLICNSLDAKCQPYPRDIMKWTEDFVYGPVFRELSERPVQSMTADDQFSMRENDYVWGDRKIAGNAQTITKGRWVHHTSFLWRFDPSRMGYLKMPSKRPAYREDREHRDFLAEISGLLPEHKREPRHFEEALQRQVDAFFQRDQEAVDAIGGATSLSAAVEKTHNIVERFLADRSNVAGDAAPPIDSDELAVLYQELMAANPQYTPRTYVVDDLHTFLDKGQQ